ncbi:MAG TPA: glycosyltransferase family 39 protein [Clostridia bacterium]|nr:glycosyltransferase family 39 protein [Clostridia bacterium]
MSENKMIKWKDKIRSGAVFFCLWGLSILYLGFNCFYHLDRTMVMSYDEARHGVNAFEMMRTGNYIVSTFNYHNDYWNLKPPMSFWAIILDFKIFGTTVLGLRFYSALALFLTILMISVFLLKRYGKIECLVITTMLACCFSFYAGHFGRNGDADALYGLFLTAGALALFYVKDNHAFLYLTGAMFSLAFLTKSWHAFILLAVTAACLAAGGQLKRIRPAEWLIFGLCSFGPILIWAAARFHYDGMRFFSGMVSYDLMKRSSSVIEGHQGDAFYYVTELFVNTYYTGLFYLLAFLVVIVAVFGMKSGRIHFSRIRPIWNDLMFYGLWILVPTLLYSIAKSKIKWYVYPLIYPLVIFTGF